MTSKSFKVSFTLDESDAAYFRKLYRTAKQHSSPEDRPKILKEVSGLIGRVRATKKAPGAASLAVGRIPCRMLSQATMLISSTLAAERAPESLDRPRRASWTSPSTTSQRRNSSRPLRGSSSAGPFLSFFGCYD